MNKLVPFPWYGGKYSQLDWLLPLLPPSRQYCEPFGGSCAILLNRTPSLIETYNDLDGELVNFFKCLRDYTEDLVSLLSLTPVSRQEYIDSINPDSSLSPIERARLFFVRARQVRTGLAQKPSPGRWAHYKTVSRSGVSGSVARWINSVEHLPEIAERLLNVQIENRPAIDVIHACDDKETLFYLDPPYFHESRSDKNVYFNEMNFNDHSVLIDVLRNIKGRFVYSGYECEQLRDIIPTDWIEYSPGMRNANSSHENRKEIVWANFDFFKHKKGMINILKRYDKHT